MSFRNLECWKASRDLIKVVFDLCPVDFTPSYEWKRKSQYLTDQLNRSALSVASNIAEGYGRRSDTQLKHFLDMSLGSLAELECQIEIYSDLVNLGPNKEKAITLVERVRRLTLGLKNSLGAVPGRRSS